MIEDEGIGVINETDESGYNLSSGSSKHLKENSMKLVLQTVKVDKKDKLSVEFNEEPVVQEDGS